MYCSLFYFSFVKLSSVQCSAVQCSAVQCSAVQCSAVQFSVMFCASQPCFLDQSVTRLLSQQLTSFVPREVSVPHVQPWKTYYARGSYLGGFFYVPKGLWEGAGVGYQISKKKLQDRPKMQYKSENGLHPIKMYEIIIKILSNMTKKKIINN